MRACRDLPKICLIRHGETAWTISGQHTGRTDIPLTDRGERDAQELSVRLRGMTFGNVLTSPLQRHGERANWQGSVHTQRPMPIYWSGTTAHTKAGGPLAWPRRPGRRLFLPGNGVGEFAGLSP